MQQPQQQQQFVAIAIVSIPINVRKNCNKLLSHKGEEGEEIGRREEE
jgi:hypothetical protein